MHAKLRVASVQPEPISDSSRWVLGALRQLDGLLASAVTAMPQSAPQAGKPETLLPGLCIEAAEVNRLLARPPSAPFERIASDSARLEAPLDAAPLSRLQKTFALSDFDLWLLLIALAPEVDLRYERLYGFLQDDVTRRRPTADLALSLLCGSAEEKLARRAHLTPEARLIRHRLLRIEPDPNQVQPSLLSFYLRLDEGILRWLLESQDLDPRLSTFCQLREPAVDLDALLLDVGQKQILANLAGAVDNVGQPLRLWFWGPRGGGKRSAAEALARMMKSRVLSADMRRCSLPEAEIPYIASALCRDARLHNAVLFVRDVDVLQTPDRVTSYHRFMDELHNHRGVVIFSAASAWGPHGGGELHPLAIPFAMPDFATRLIAWRKTLDSAGIAYDDDATVALASRFRLTAGQIAEITSDASRSIEWQPGPKKRRAGSHAEDGKQVLQDLFGAARSRCGDELGKLTHRIIPRYCWDDIILPPDQYSQLQEVCAQAKLRHVVYESWGFDRKLSLGKGLNVLFAGPPGTGKTMAAEVIAHDLELHLYKIDLSQVVSKYIGETEKNLDRIFTAAETSNAILFFDEADALFGKRSEVKDSHDRYANIEIGYLLQKMEEHEGIAILATNLRQSLDDAFVRRIQNVIEFPFPAAEQRQRIWVVTFPEETPLGEDLDFSLLGQGVKLAGGNIKNIAITAAFYAASDGGVVRMPHVIRACSREYQKLGQTWSGQELAARMPGLPASN